MKLWLTMHSMKPLTGRFFLTIMPSKAGKIFEHAVDAENWNFLAKHHKRWLLFKNGQYSLWLNSFFKKTDGFKIEACYGFDFFL